MTSTSTVRSISSRRVAMAIAGRSVKLIPRMPSTFIPSLVMPVFLTIAFAGPFGGLVHLPGFPTDNILDWVLPMTLVQGCAFAGITTGMGVARDLQVGFYDRLLASPVTRASLVAGPLLASVLRATMPITLLLVVGLVGGASFQGGPLGILALAIAGFGTALMAGAWALALALRFGTLQAAPLMQTGVFLAVFLSTAQMPIHLLTGWVHAVARFNPMTNILELAREGMIGEVAWGSTYPGLLALTGTSALLMLFTARSMKRLEAR